MRLALTIVLFAASFAQAQTITYSINENGSFSGQTQAESERDIDIAFAEASAVCGATWERVERKGRIKHYWATESEIRALGRYYYGSRKTYMNSTRELGLGPNQTQSAGRIPMTVVQHESIGHYLRWEHVHHDNYSSIMNTWARVRYLTPYDVLRLQKRFGLPAEGFYPPEQVYYGNRIRFLRAERALLVTIRDSSTDFATRAGVQIDIVKTVTNEITASLAWWVVKRKWMNVPMAR